jgi:hypothetical protein
MFYILTKKEIRKMADDVQHLRDDIAKARTDVTTLVGVVGGLKTKVTDLTSALEAAKVAGFTVPADLLTEADSLVAEADKAVADASSTDSIGSVEVSGS